jgi:thiamine biosynthesis lipoprotein
MPSPSLNAEEVRAAQADVRRARPLLGTLVEIAAGADQSAESLHAAIDAGFAAIARVHSLMSCQEPGSELSRLSRSSGNQVQRVDPHTYRVLEAALRMAKLSGGAFDPCVESGSAGGFGGWRDIELMDGNAVKILRPLRLDLGGIAKGYAVDLAVRTLQELGIGRIAVNAGGDLRIAGPLRQPVHMRHPQAPFHLAHTVVLHNASLATSAAYYSRRLVRGRAVSALIDPRGGDSYVGNRSISVRADDCMTADALTKVVLFADAGVAELCLSAFHAEAYVLEPDQAPAEFNRSMSARSNFNCVAATKSFNDRPWWRSR